MVSPVGPDTKTPRSTLPIASSLGAAGLGVPGPL